MTPGLTTAELADLEAKGFPVDQTVLVETKTLQVQIVGQATDPATGQPMLLFAFIAPLPATLLRPRPTLLGPDGQPIGGGVAGCMPIPATVRVLLQQEAINPAFVPVRVPVDEAVGS